MKAIHDGLSRDWVVSRRHGSSYTSGSFSILSGGLETRDYAACLCSDRVALLHLPSGLVARFVSRPSAEEAVSFAASIDGSKLVVFYRNLMARVYDPRLLLKNHRRKLLTVGEKGVDLEFEEEGGGEGGDRKVKRKMFDLEQEEGVLRSWRCGHRLQVTCAEFDQSSTLVVTGSADKTVMVYDAEQGFATHSFKNGHDELITCVRFQPHTTSVQRIVSASSDGRVCIWDLISHSCVASLAGQHYSAVTSVIFSTDVNAHYMITCGRDKVINVWDSREFSNTSSSQSPASFLKITVAAQEGIESAVMLPSDANETESTSLGDDQSKEKEMTFLTVGDRGLLRKWTLSITGISRAQRKFAIKCISTQTALGLKRRLPSTLSSTNISESSLSSSKTANTDEVPVSQQFEHVLLHRETVLSVPKALDEKSQQAVTKSGAKRRRRSSEADTEIVATTSKSLVLESPKYIYRLLCITRDQVVTFTSVSDLKAIKVICGYNDQIIDVRYIPGQLPSPSSAAPKGTSYKTQSLLAVATNSEQLRIVNAQTFDSTLCDGHEDVILSLSPSPEGTLIATASKDKTVRIWDVITGTCVAICEGHTESVSAVSFSSKPTAFTRWISGGTSTTAPVSAGTSGWIVSAGKDHSIKVWQLGPILSRLPSPRPEVWSVEDLSKCIQAATSERKDKSLVFKPRTIASAIAHEKEINAVAVSPNDKLIASASQDRTIKLWSAPELAPGGQAIAILRGHKRGVWSIAFSPSDQVLASASGDGTLRLWAVSQSAGYACLRTFEGHDASALCVRFLRRGLQLVSSGADGLVKLWSVKDAECINTFDAHTDKVWALAVRPGEFNEPLEASVALAAIASGSGTTVTLDEREIVSGGGDSVLNIWRDVTSLTAQSEVAAAEEAIQKQQSLLGAMATRDYTRTLSLTLELDQPGRCGDVLQEMLEVGPTPPLSTSGADAERRNAEAILKELEELNEEAEGLVNIETKNRKFFGMHEEGALLAASVIASLNGPLLSTLLRFVREWGTQARHGFLAQRILFIILKTIPQKILVRKLAEEKYNSKGGRGGGGGGSILKMLPGIGAARYISKPGALDEEADLAPVAVSVSSMDTNSGVVGALLDAESRRLTDEEKAAEISAAAAAELRGLISSLLPYSERHLERLDRLLISTHSVDYTLHSMQALIPDQNGYNNEEDMDLALVGRGTSLRMRSTQRFDNDDDDDDNDNNVEDDTSEAWVFIKKDQSKEKIEKKTRRVSKISK
jgi:WD40 repeat protein